MNLDFNHIKNIPQLIKDFLNDDLGFAGDKIFKLDNVSKQIELKEKSFPKQHREVLHASFTKQLQALKLTESQSKNIELLKDSDTFTVTTGHQLNLFTGPVFFVYKILQTIKTASFLKEKFPTKNFVPIFWMATEDHDFDEIDHFKTENHFYQIKGKQGGAVGRIKVEDQFFISEFEREFKDHVYGTELILMMKEAYKLGNTLTEATRSLVQNLFADYGLLMLDGDDRDLKKLMIPTFKKELLNEQLYKTTSEKRNLLEQNYHKVQVNPREINLFYLTETRNRIEKSADVYKVLDTEVSFSETEILNELENFPERFSPNAVLRPAYQESILPNLAYIGGNAEIMYWLELPDFFESIELPFPILIPRNSLLFLNEKTFKKIEKLNLSITEFFEDFSVIVKKHLVENHPLHELLIKQEEALKNHFSILKNEAGSTDISFKNLVEAEETRQLKSFDKMQKRLLRAEKIKQAELMSRYEELFLKVHPGGIWQERQFNFSVFYADAGRDWLKFCYQLMNVEKSELIISHLI
ncbi:bacillithiol biosynthesis cysteine-adding enzyme BshC [Soonwooa sp.]|uniref:bacillithiol biosynthesis cysteine-adding enzyme BshC n=1 Tax=Soonwooa sp. TaxID=1938592 RepID=UPI002616BBD6|nr:bacillithiol biosynthesis cysteine-adding enzyme BshC [Soonwooa sp.]